MVNVQTKKAIARDDWAKKKITHSPIITASIPSPSRK
jgi:hypothetical protein